MWRILFQLIRKIKRKIGTNWRFNQWKCWRRTKMSEYVIEEPLEFMAQNIIKSRSSLHAHRNTRIHFGIDYTYQYPMWMARISIYDGENWTIERGKKGNDFWYFSSGIIHIFQERNYVGQPIRLSLKRMENHIWFLFQVDVDHYHSNLWYLFSNH